MANTGQVFRGMKTTHGRNKTVCKHILVSATIQPTGSPTAAHNSLHYHVLSRLRWRTQSQGQSGLHNRSWSRKNPTNRNNKLLQKDNPTERTWELARLVKHLSCKDEDLSWSPEPMFLILALGSRGLRCRRSPGLLDNQSSH